MREFTLPRDGEVYADSILARCRQLISTHIWNGITPTTLNAWLGNFNGDLEKYFAACLLDALIYRSAEQTTSLMEEVFTNRIPAATDSLASSRPLQDLKASLRGTVDPSVRLVPVIRSSDPPTKSGPLLARLYRRRLQLNDRWMLWPWQVKEYMKESQGVIIYIDDLLGTGTQFLRFLEHFSLADLADHPQIYAPLTAHSSGKTYINENVPHVAVAEAESLGEGYNLFAKGSLAFSDGHNDSEGAKNFYLDLLERHSLPIPDQYLFGWGELALTYVFDHAVPNNSLPLYWFSTKDWAPLFRR